MPGTIFPEEPVFDRTQADVDNRTKKGFFNVSDWNRVVKNLIALRDWIVANMPTEPTNNTSWSPSVSTKLNNSYLVDRSKFPTAEMMNTVSQSINELRMGVTLVSVGWQAIYQNYTAGKDGTGNMMDFQELNRWEQDLEIQERVLTGIVEMRTYCNDANGSYFCGDWKRGGLL